MAINLSTAGIHLLYAVEETAGTRPTTSSAYTDLVGVKSTPSLNPRNNIIKRNRIQNLC